MTDFVPDLDDIATVPMFSTPAEGKTKPSASVQDIQTVTDTPSEEARETEVYSLEEPDFEIGTPLGKGQVPRARVVLCARGQLYEMESASAALDTFHRVAKFSPSHKTRLVEKDETCGLYRVAFEAQSLNVTKYVIVSKRRVVSLKPGTSRPLSIIG
jgi:hypothetical protein